MVTEYDGEGIDLVNASVTFTIAGGVENLTLTGTSPINGTGNGLDNVLTGNTGVNVLTGEAGNDTLNGGAGADTLIGGIGNDTYIVDSALDAVGENLDEGIDTVDASIDWMLGEQLENLTLTGTSVNGTGNALNNSITGNASANRLNGGSGADTMIGGTGNDVYVVDNVGDVTSEAANAGTDSVESAIGWALATHVENLTLTGTASVNGTGNAGVNTLRGNSAANVLDGGAGADVLIGGGGDDVYVVDSGLDVVTELNNEGQDRIDSAVTINTLANYVEDLTLTGTGSINGGGNALDNKMVGNTGVNVLTGGMGADSLDGGSGNDTLGGGSGSDGYRFGLGYGIDTIQENDTTASVTDAVQFLNGLTRAEATFKQVGNNLEVLLNGTLDKVIVQSWYLGTQYQVEEFRFEDATVLNTQVQSLITAMAGFGTADVQPVSPSNDLKVSNHMLAANALPM